MINWIFDNFDKKSISIKKSSAFPSPNFFFLFIITKCACFTIWTSFALKFGNINLGSVAAIQINILIKILPISIPILVFVKEQYQYQYQYCNIRAIYSSNMKKALFSNNSRFFWQYIA